MQVARILRDARRSAGLTQRELAVGAGMPQSTVARIERGLLMPRWNTFERLLRATGHVVELAPTPGQGVDRSQIRALLRLSPGERARLAVADAAGLEGALSRAQRTRRP